MELIAIGFLLGIIACIVFVGVGMIYADKMANRKHGHGDNNRVLRSIPDDNPDNRVGKPDQQFMDRYHMGIVTEEEIREMADKLNVKIGGYDDSIK